MVLLWVFFWIRGPQDAGACVGGWEWLGFSLAGLRLAGPVDFANASWGRLRGRQYYKSRRCAGRRGCLGVKDLDPKIPPLGAKGWGTGKSNPSHPSRRRRRVGHPQNLRLNSKAACSREIIRKLRYRRVSKEGWAPGRESFTRKPKDRQRPWGHATAVPMAARLMARPARLSP